LTSNMSLPLDFPPFSMVLFLLFSRICLHVCTRAHFHFFIRYIPHLASLYHPGAATGTACRTGRLPKLDHCAW
jgi:hypothetical protein